MSNTQLRKILFNYELSEALRQRRSNKRLNYGFNGYKMPAVPRASRSARGKRSFIKKAEDSHKCAFDLLATIAGELLLLKESALSPSSVSPGRDQFVTAKDTIKQEQQDEEKQFKHDPCGQGSCDDSASATKLGSHMHVSNNVLKDNSHSQNGATSPPSITANFITLERVASGDESITDKNRDESIIHRNWPSERRFSGFVECCVGKVDCQTKGQLEVGQQRIGFTINGTTPNMSSSEDPMELNVKRPLLVSSDSSVKVPFCRDLISSGLFVRCQDDVKEVSRDDNENSSGCTQPRTISFKAFRPPHLRNRRIRKMLSYKLWEVAPTMLKDEEISYTGLETKPVFPSRDLCYTRRRTQRCSPFKRRKLWEKSSISIYEGKINSEGASNSPGKDSNGEAVGSDTTVHEASRAASPVAGQESSFKSEDSHVTLRIKSFWVPELFIEIPETATVWSLKTTVVEAVSSILGGGLRVGVLQGTKVGDDNKTLLQTGIAHDDKLGSLGFMLEPNPAHAPSLCSEDHPHLLVLCDEAKPLTSFVRYAVCSHLRYSCAPRSSIGQCRQLDQR